MRYTTILDLRDWPNLYRNINIRLVYLHLCLCSGYHDYNRDVTKISVRGLAADSGLTESAVRHALRQLEKYKIIKRKNGTTMVAKWLKEQSITPRTQASQGGTITAHLATSTRDAKAVTKEEYLRMKQAREEQRK